jgi:fatty acid-binding protein DegV
MQIVADSGYDLSPQQKAHHTIHTLPLKLTLSGISYRSGIDIQPEEFYALLAETEDMPVTSTPSQGEFLGISQQLAEKGEEVL